MRCVEQQIVWLEVSNFDDVACWEAPLVVAMRSRWMLRSDRLKGVPPDSLRNQITNRDQLKMTRGPGAKSSARPGIWEPLCIKGGGVLVVCGRCGVPRESKSSKRKKARTFDASSVLLAAQAAAPACHRPALQVCGRERLRVVGDFNGSEGK